MAKVTLARIIEDWIKELGTELYFDSNRILHPCECGQGHWTYARLEDKQIILPKTQCTCRNCRRKSIDMVTPDSFAVLKRTLKARIKHKSVVVGEIWDADELAHAIRHQPDGGKLDLHGTIDGAYVDAAKYDINVSAGAVITNSQFINIMNPITVSGTVSFIGNGFYASKEQPLTATFDVQL